MESSLLFEEIGDDGVTSDTLRWTDHVDINKDELLPYMKCPICLDIMNDVVIVMTCLDRFCAICIEKCVRSESVQHVCPCCRCKIPSRRALRRDACFDSLIRDIESSQSVVNPLHTDAGAGAGITNMEKYQSLILYSKDEHAKRVSAMKSKANINKTKRKLLEANLSADLDTKQKLSRHGNTNNSLHRNIINNCYQIRLSLWPDVSIPYESIHVIIVCILYILYMLYLGVVSYTKIYERQGYCYYYCYYYYC